MKTFTLIFAALMINGAVLHAADPADTVARADAFRGAFDSYVIDVDLTSYRGGTVASTSKLRVYGRGADRSVVEFLAPAAEKGRRLLMLRDAMWIYLPSASRPIRISPLQRLMGDASNGDVARSSFSVDYDAIRAASVEMDGQRFLKVELQAKGPGIAYEKVHLFVDPSSGEPRRADFFAGSGKLLKTAWYRSFSMMAERRVVSEIEIEDRLRAGHRTVMRYSNLASRNHPDRMFTRDGFGR